MTKKDWSPGSPLGIDKSKEEEIGSEGLSQNHKPNFTKPYGALRLDCQLCSNYLLDRQSGLQFKAQPNSGTPETGRHGRELKMLTRV
jgi:hypothetical protein